MAKSGMFGVDSESEENAASQKSQENEYTICKPVNISTPTSILIESLVKNLCSIYEPDQEKANKIYNFVCSKLHEMKMVDESYSMTEFEGMRNQYQRALYRLVTSAIGGKQPIPSLQEFWHNNDVTNEWSHYYREFDEVEFIAEGGFGKVFRVKHKLDGTEYAIKKIYIRSEGIKAIRSYLSEAKTFASLNHSNIVQYKAAWFELGTENNAIGDDNDSSTLSYATDVVESDNNHYIYPKAISKTETICTTSKFTYDNSDFEIDFEDHSKLYSFSSNNVLQINKAVRKTRIKRNSISEGGNAICKIDDIKHLQSKAKHHSKWATLYIQMSLCQSTLRHWLEKRNGTHRTAMHTNSVLVPYGFSKTHHDTVMDILLQLLRGIEYMHFKDIVHHDIKPSNIFIQFENGQILVQLGDFGLACPLQSNKHSLAFGTKLYAAPEQLSGACNSKSDMYSLGIVLFELAETFSTDMERVEAITELRKGHLTARLSNEQPQIDSIIKQLVARSPSARPSATSLLQEITVNVSELVNDLQCQLAKKDDEISKLKEILKNVGYNA